MNHDPLTIMCQRCGRHVRLFQGVSGRWLPGVHECRRFLMAEQWEDGHITRRFASVRPGVTGPATLVRQHGAKADDGRTHDGWSYRWAVAS